MLFRRALFTFDALMITWTISGMRGVYVVGFLSTQKHSFAVAAAVIILNVSGALLMSVAVSTIEAWAFRMPAQLRTAVLCLGAAASVFAYVYHSASP